MIVVDLPYPHKLLWPNGRAHWAAKAVQVKRHRQWADTATLEAIGGRLIALDAFQPIPVAITVRPKPTGREPDRDNVVAACKAYLDGIAQRLHLDDRMFATPVVQFARPRDGRFVIKIGGGE